MFKNRLNPISVSQLVALILAASTSILSAKFSGARSWGLISYLNTLVAFGCMVATIGIPIELARTEALNSSRVRTNYLLLLLTSALSVGLVGALLIMRLKSLSEDSYYTAWCTAILVAVLTFNEGLLAIIQGRGQNDLLAILRVISVAFPGISVCLAAYFCGTAEAMSLALVVAAVATLTSSIAALFKSRRKIPILDLPIQGEKRQSGFAVGALRSYLSTLLVYLGYRVDLLVGGFFIPPAQFAEYSLAVLAGEVLWISANGNSISSLVRNSRAPMASRAKVVANLAVKSLKPAVLVLFLSVPGFAILTLFFGKENYSNIAPLFYLVAAGMIGYVPVKIFLSFEIAQGNSKDVMIVTFITIAAKLLTILLLWKLQAFGLGIGLLFAYLTASGWVFQRLRQSV